MMRELLITTCNTYKPDIGVPVPPILTVAVAPRDQAAQLPGWLLHFASYCSRVKNYH